MGRLNRFSLPKWRLSASPCAHLLLLIIPLPLSPSLASLIACAIVQSLASNLSFIERYRYAPKLAAEASYFFVQMVGKGGGG